MSIYSNNSNDQKENNNEAFILHPLTRDNNDFFVKRLNNLLKVDSTFTKEKYNEASTSDSADIFDYFFQKNPTYKNNLKFNPVVLSYPSNNIAYLNEERFNRCTSLECIHLDNNEIEEVPSNIFNGSRASLTSINFENNQIEILSANLFSGCASLQYINFSSNFVKDLSGDIFRGCNKSLQTVIFSNNQLELLKCTTFSECTKLQKIDFSRNQIKSIDAKLFDWCLSLRNIDFTFNRIEKLDPNLFDLCKHCRDINFSSNRIKALHPRLFINFVNKSENTST